MADIRINSLPSTATSFNTDDYIPIDGASGGTRKMLAATLPLTDVKFGGASGPSAKSSIAARAARQGLVFDGTAGAPCTLGSAIGTSDATIAAFIDVPSSNPSAIRTIAYIATGAAWKPNDCVFYIETNGTLNFQLRGTLVGDTRIATVTENLVSSYGGKRVLVTATRVGTTLTIFINGVSAAFTVAGSAITWANSIDGTILRVGDLSGNSLPFVGFIAPYIENRALSAAEVVSLYESGVPSGSDYNNASNTSLLTGANSDFSSAGNWSVQGATTISGGKLNLSNGDAAYNGLAPLTVGKRYRLTITVDSLTAGLVQYYNGSTYVAFASAPGTYTVDFTCAATFAPGLHLRSSGGNAVLDTALYYPLGLLLAPDAAQAGGGLTWYDTSGNAANITLPASGVTWNVPSSGYWGGNFALGGTKLALPSGSLFGMTGTTGALSVSNYALFQDGTQTFLNTPTGGSVQLRVNNVEQLRVFSNGNVGIGVAGTDGGQKLQVAGNVQITNTGANGLVVTNTQGNALAVFNNSAADASGVNNGYFTIQTASSPRWYFGQSVSALSGDFQIYSVALGASVLSLAKSTGDATFAGQINGNAGFRFRGATGTFYELLRYVGGSNNPGLYVRATEATSTIRLDVSGSSGPFPFEIASGGTLAATFTGADAKLYGKINAASLPTSSAGLSAGDLWVDTAAGNVVKRV